MRGVARKVSTPQWPGVPAMWFERAAHGSAQRSVDRLPVQSLRSVSHHPDWDRLRENAPSALDGRFDPARDRQGEPTARLARELGIGRPRMHDIRKQVQTSLRQALPSEPMTDEILLEADELYQNAGEKR